MTPLMKGLSMPSHLKIVGIAFAAITADSVISYRVFKRARAIQAQSEAKTELIAYLATIIDESDIELTEFDRIAITSIISQ